MKMLLMTDSQYEELRYKIAADTQVTSLAQQYQGCNYTESQPWELQIARMLLGGVITVDGKDPKAEKLANKARNKMETTRYGYNDKGQRKNVLFTIRDDNKGVIYFGVSRCDLTCDKFDKDAGIKIAKERALRAQSAQCSSGDDVPLYGVAIASRAKFLVEWFDKIG